ncbi:MAG: efflux RND transporter periplasmic adaptor subunit [Pirellulaceae bacterium]
MNLTIRQKMFAGLLLGLLIVASVVAVVISQSGAGDDAAKVDASAAQAKVPSLPAMRLQAQGSYLRSVAHSGTVHPRQRTMVAFQRGGKVDELLVDEGHEVTANADLARLDRRQLEAQSASLKARLAQANSVLAELRKGPRQEDIETARATVSDLEQQLKGQELRLGRSEALLESNSIPRQEYERELFATGALDARLKAAQSQLDELLAGTRSEQIEAQSALVRSIEAEQKLAQHDLDDCLLQAPFSGMIVSRLIDDGAVVAAGTPVFELIDNRNLEVHVGVPLSTAAQMKPEQVYRIHAGDNEVSGTLRTVLPQLESGTRTRKAIFDVTLDTRSSTLIAGQLVRVELSEQIDEAGFWVPVSALTADHSGLWSCFVLQPDTTVKNYGVVKKQSVEILHQRDEYVYVRGTLQDGQLLVSAGLQRIVAGQKIAIEIDDATRVPDVTSTDRLER